jgi:hypothetical protein
MAQRDLPVRTIRHGEREMNRRNHAIDSRPHEDLSLPLEGPAREVRPVAARSRFRSGLIAIIGLAVLLALADYVTQGAPTFDGVHESTAPSMPER